MQITFTSKGETLPATLYAHSSKGVILCPPHPLYGGTRNDTRIVRIARELASRGISALCIDYGSYGKGVEEVQNVLDAVSFMGKKVDCLGLVGYSFGAVVASNVVGQTEIDGYVAMSILKRVDGIDAILDFACPKLFVHGKRDKVAPYSDFKQLYQEANERKERLVLDTDHFYMENYPTIIDLASKSICKFFAKIFSK
jgi:alpha/beta superfamily hydrolase